MGNVMFQLQLHEVSSLLVEDWNEGIGFQISGQKGNMFYKPTSYGQVFIKTEDNKIAVAESDELPFVIDTLIAGSVNEVIYSDPGLHLKPSPPNS